MVDIYEAIYCNLYHIKVIQIIKKRSSKSEDFLSRLAFFIFIHCHGHHQLHHPHHPHHHHHLRGSCIVQLFSDDGSVPKFATFQGGMSVNCIYWNDDQIVTMTMVMIYQSQNLLKFQAEFWCHAFFSNNFLARHTVIAKALFSAENVHFSQIDPDRGGDPHT